MATDQERARARNEIQTLVWEELHRVVALIRAENALGVQPELTIRVSRYGGPTLVIDEEDVEGLPLALLSELAGQNLDLRLHRGRLELYSAAWQPDSIPF